MIHPMLERKTTISKHVLMQLKVSTSPLSVGQLLANLEQHGLHPNKTTIYRILEKLMNKKAVTEIPLRNGVTYFELSHGHHHHFICNECDAIVCLKTCHVESLDINLTELLPNKQFRIQSHDFNLYGICEPCSNN